MSSPEKSSSKRQRTVRMSNDSFVGKHGEAVECIPKQWKDLDEGAYEEMTEKYEFEPSFREEIGPIIPLCYENDIVLIGLQLDINFGKLGCMRGIVRKSDWGGCEIEWRCGPNYDAKSAFFSKHEEQYEAISWYFLDKEKPDWLKTEDCLKRSVIDLIKNIQSAPTGTEFVNWKRPNECYEETTHYEGINDEDKWWITLARLNDPKMAYRYGSASDAYPTLAILTIYLIEMNRSESNHAPVIMVTKDNEDLFKLSDCMCREVSGTSSYGTGYGNLMGFEKIVERVKKDFPPEKAKTDDQVWKGGYLRAQALMLVLSKEFEEAMWDYDMVDDLDRLDGLVADFLVVFGSYMSPAAIPSDAAKEQLKRDLDFNDKHLRAGVFVGYALENHKELFASTFAMCVKSDEARD